MSGEAYNVLAEEFVPMAMQPQVKVEQEPECFMELQDTEYLMPGTLHPCQTESYPVFYEQHPQQPQNVYTFAPNSVYTPSNPTQQQFFFSPSASDLSSANSTSFGYGYGECASTPSTPSSMSAGTSAPSSDSLQMPTLQMNQHDFIQQQQQIPQQQPLQNNLPSQPWNSFPLCQQHQNMLLNLAAALKMRQTLNNLKTLANLNGLNGMLNLMQSLNKQNNTTSANQTNAAANTTSNDSTDADSNKGCKNPYFQWMLLLMQQQYGMSPPSDLFNQNKQSDSASASSKGRSRGKNRKKQTPTMALRDQVENMKDELNDLMVRLKLKKNTDSSNETFASLLKLLESRFSKLKSERNQLKSANERHKKSQAETKKLRAELKELKASIKRKEAKTKKKENAL